MEAEVDERRVEVLLVQQDPQQVERTLEVLRHRPFGTRIHVMHDAGAALELLLGSGPYADQRPAAPRLVLFHLGPGEDERIAVLERIVRDPLTSRFPVTVLTDTPSQRRAALAELRRRHLHLPVVAITDLPQSTTPVPLPTDADGQVDDEDGAWIVAGAGERRPPRHPRPAAPPAPPVPNLERQIRALTELAQRLAHEFNNLLTVVVANTELLLRDLDLDDPRRQSTEDIFRAVERASKLTSQLMELAPPDMPPPNEPFRPSRPRVIRGGNRPGAA